MNVVRALVAGGYAVAATRRLHCNTLFARRLGAPLITAELDDVDELTEAMRGRNIVFNCAGHYPRYSLDREGEVATARRRVRNTLEAARRAGVERYVLTSSSATIGPPRAGRTLSDEQDGVEPRSLAGVYHAVKAAIEDEVLAVAKTGLEVILLLPTAIFGELDVKAGTGFLIVAVGRRALPFLIEGPVNVVDADDLAHAHILAAEHGVRGERYIVGGHNLTVTPLLQLFANRLGVQLDAPLIPLDLAGWRSTLAEARVCAAGNGARAAMSRELIDIVRFGRHVDSSKAETQLGLSKPTPLATTLAKACDWYVRHHYLRLNHGDSHAQHYQRASTN
jgi:dihydroflavonol-4-reductase